MGKVKVAEEEIAEESVAVTESKARSAALYGRFEAVYSGGGVSQATTGQLGRDDTHRLILLTVHVPTQVTATLGIVERQVTAALCVILTSSIEIVSAVLVVQNTSRRKLLLGLSTILKNDDPLLDVGLFGLLLAFFPSKETETKLVHLAVSCKAFRDIE